RSRRPRAPPRRAGGGSCERRSRFSPGQRVVGDGSVPVAPPTGATPCWLVELVGVVGSVAPFCAAAITAGSSTVDPSSRALPIRLPPVPTTCPRGAAGVPSAWPLATARHTGLPLAERQS